MKKLILPSLKVTLPGLCLAFALLAYNAKADGYFDVNGTAAGYGVVNGGSYSWDDPNWAAATGGTSPTAAWVPGSFARFPGGASGNSYTVTVNADESMAGLYETVTGVHLIINAAGSGTLDVATGDQGFLVSGSTSSVMINAPISGAGGVAPELSGSLYLYGNNTYSGGTKIGYSGATLTYFNNSHSFGTGPIVNTYTAAGSYAALLSTGGSLITLPNDFQITVSGNGFNFASGANTPVRSTGNWSLGANNLLVRNNGDSTAPLTISGVISGTAGISLSANNGGAVILNGANTYSGTTTVGKGTTAVTLKLGAANTIASSSQVIMAGGILDPAGFHHAMSSTTLSLTANSTIDFTSGAAELDFGNSSGAAWTSGMTLNLMSTSPWNNSSDFLQIGTDATGLAAGQLAQIEFNGADLGAAGINAQGFIFDTAAVPEPSAVVLSLLGGLGLLWNVRRREV